MDCLFFLRGRVGLFLLTFTSDDRKTSQITLQIIMAKNLANYLGVKLIKPLPFQALTQMLDSLLVFCLSMLLIAIFWHFISGCCMPSPTGLGWCIELLWRSPSPHTLTLSAAPDLCLKWIEKHSHKYQHWWRKLPSSPLIFTVTEAGAPNYVHLFLIFPRWNRWNLWDSHCLGDIFPQLW